MVKVELTITPEVLDVFPPPPQYGDIWNEGLVYAHQYTALMTDARSLKIHAPTATGKSRAAAFFAVSPYHLHNDMISATFAYPTNILTDQQFENGLIDGLRENLDYRDLGEGAWPPYHSDGMGIPYKRLKTPEGEELTVAKLTGKILADALLDDAIRGGKADVLEKFMDWLNQRHNFLIASPDVLAYASHELYGSASFYYHSGRKTRLHSLLRGRTLVLDEYHEYDSFTLINLERLLADSDLSPKRVLLLSATGREDFFPDIPVLHLQKNLPSPASTKVASSSIYLTFHFEEEVPSTIASEGLSLYIHDSVVQNRLRCSQLRKEGTPVVQWDGTRKDSVKNTDLGSMYHNIMGTSAVEVGLDTAANAVITEWHPAWVSIDHIVQRIGRAGRRKSSIPSLADVYVFDDNMKGELSRMEGLSLTKDELSAMLYKIYQGYYKRSFNRKDYVSYYFSNEGEEELRKQHYLDPYDRLRFSFRPPGSLALFLDRTESEPYLFLYDKVLITNRYEDRPPTPDDLDFVGEGWRRFCKELQLDIKGEDFRVIYAQKTKRDWIARPTGDIKDLKGNLRKYYVERKRG